MTEKQHVSAPSHLVDVSGSSDLSHLSVICSLKIDSADRLRNFHLFLKFFASLAPACEVIVVEQGAVSQLEQISNETFRHHFIQSNEAHYKTRNLNLAASLSTRPYILMLDVDAFLPPQAIFHGLKRMREGADVVSPYNGLTINVKHLASEKISAELDLTDFLEHLPFFDKSSCAGAQAGVDVAGYRFELLFGSKEYDSTGCALMFKREAFFGAGGFNTNIISYGFEDMEICERLTKLGYALEQLSQFNCYHFDHARLQDSYYNNFYRSNENEYQKVRAMEAAQLRNYAQKGFKLIDLDGRHDLKIVNNECEFHMQLNPHKRQSLSQVSIVWAIRYLFNRPVPGLLTFLDFMEAHFDDYEIIIVEVLSRKFKYLRNQKNIKYFWLDQTYTVDDAADRGAQLTTRNDIDVYKFDGTIDAQPMTDKYRGLWRTSTAKDLYRQALIDCS